MAILNSHSSAIAWAEGYIGDRNRSRMALALGIVNDAGDGAKNPISTIQHAGARHA